MAKPWVVLQDPHHPYGEYMIDLLYRKYGMRSVCFYTEPLRHRIEARKYPILNSEAIAASYLVNKSQLDRFGELLATSKNRIAAVMPLTEPAVVPAARLAARLGLSWAQPEIMNRFRDKFALKQFIANRSDGPRINAIKLVTNTDEALTFVTDSNLTRFVLKPPNGFGNGGIGIFDATVNRDRISEFLRKTHKPILLEEYLDGEEYFVNGQVDTAGKVTVFAIFNNSRISANGRHGLHTQYRKVNYSDSRFEILADYATQVVASTGLLRSPFHAEVIIDNRGPCLVEIAARLCGTNNVFEMNDLQGGQFDACDIAAHYYLTAEDYGPIPVNWPLYDRFAYRQLLGVSHESGCIYQLRGVAEVEQLPQFADWVQRPTISQHLTPTVDLFTTPWKLRLRGTTETELDTTSQWIRANLHWNYRPTGTGVAGANGIDSNQPGGIDNPAKPVASAQSGATPTQPHRNHHPAARTPAAPSAAVRAWKKAKAYTSLLSRYRFAIYPRSPVNATRVSR